MAWGSHRIPVMDSYVVGGFAWVLLAFVMGEAFANTMTFDNKVTRRYEYGVSLLAVSKVSGFGLNRQFITGVVKRVSGISLNYM